MTNGLFLLTASVVAILAGVTLLAVLSALTLRPLGGYGRRYVVAFIVCQRLPITLQLQPFFPKN